MCDVSMIALRSGPVHPLMRASTDGPEMDIVRRFVAAYKKRAQKSSWKHDVAIFVEPKLGSGYPDLVIAHYDSRVAKSSRLGKEPLRSQDLKLLSALMACGGVGVPDLARRSGFGEKQVSTSLHGLEDLGLAICSRDKWRNSPKSSFFALERLVTVEAKVANSSKALEQAIRNICFSSASFALMGCESMTDRLKSRYEQFGVGVIAGKDFKVFVKPRRSCVPICFSSLLVNQWVCELACAEGEHG